jgi:threonine dehydrogenase-like Zn-dependent dehydrogenase
MTRETYRAAILCGPEDLRHGDLDVPAPGPEEVLVRVKACALCGSDVSAYFGRHPRITFPRVMGHEYAGVVWRKGERVSGWENGQRVCCDCDLPCGECDLCRQGRRNLCLRLKTQGFDSDGAYADLVRVPQRNLHLLPERVSFEEASMVQTLAVAYNGVRRRGEVKVQDRVLIFGCGAIGLCALAVAKASGAQVFMVDTIEYRLEKALAMGADRVFNGAQGNFIEAVLEATGGKGVDKVIEAVGGSQDVTLSQATQVVKRAGLIVVIGTFSLNKATLRMAEFKDREMDLRGARGYVDAFPDCLELIASGKINLKPLITHRLPLAEVEKGLLLMRDKSENVMKVIISP